MSRRSLNLLMLAAALALWLLPGAARGQVLLTPEITWDGSLYHYHYTLTNNTLSDLSLITIQTVAGADVALNPGAPDGFQLIYDMWKWAALLCPGGSGQRRDDVRSRASLFGVSFPESASSRMGAIFRARCERSEGVFRSRLGSRAGTGQPGDAGRAGGNGADLVAATLTIARRPFVTMAR